MTNREFFNCFNTDKDAITAETWAEMCEHAAGMRDKLDAAAAARATKAKEKSKESEPLRQAIFQLITERGAMTSPEIAEAMTSGGTDMTTAKASALCRQMVTDGRLVAAEIKVPKKGKLKQYNLA